MACQEEENQLRRAGTVVGTGDHLGDPACHLAGGTEVHRAAGRAACHLGVDLACCLAGGKEACLAAWDQLELDRKSVV